jgi:GxxExxY protein
MMAPRSVRTTMALMTAKRPEPERRWQLAEAELTERIIGAFYRVYNRLGYGFLEAVYSRALAFELTRAGLHVQREVMVDVFDEGLKVGAYRADILVESRVVVENKATSTLVQADRDQLLNYLRCSCLEVGLLFHFGPRPAFKRVVAENSRSRDPVISKSPATIVVPTDPAERRPAR